MARREGKIEALCGWSEGTRDGCLGSCGDRTMLLLLIHQGFAGFGRDLGRNLGKHIKNIQD